MTAERRIGKTTVTRKMEGEPQKEWLPVYQDLESVHSAAEFAMAVYKVVHHFLGRKERFMRRTKEWFQHLGGTEIGGLFTLPAGRETHWKDILTKSVEDLTHENDASGDRLLFLWDEVPYMLDNIRKREGPERAMEVLDLLRALRQTHPKLRMIITGSIGLHHVITALKDSNYANAPVNDMAGVEVPPLEPDDAMALACQLIEGEALASPDRDAAAAAIAHEADYFPFYVHHIVKALKVRGWEATPERAAQVVREHLVDADDPWELLHYRTRIPTYYGADADAVLLILDELAVRDEPATVANLLSMLKGASKFDDRERLLRLLSLMQRDHYLKRDEDGRFSFRFPLIRRWWKLNRGL